MGDRQATVARAFFLVAWLAVLLGLAACGGGGEEEGQGTPAAGTGTAAPSGPAVEITLWHSETASNLDSLEALVNRYNGSQSEVKVKLVYQGTPDDNMAKVMASLQGGQLPTIACLDEVRVQQLIDSGAFRPVQEFIDAEDYDLSDFDAKTIQYFTLDGTLWAMPISIAVPVFYYNKVPFREVGLDPEHPPQDLEQVKEIARKLVKRDSQGNVTRTGMTLDLSPWLVEATLGEHGDFYVNNENGRAGRATEVLFNGPAGQELFQWWDDMIKEGLAINVGRNPSGADTLLPIAADQAVMTWGSSAALRSIVDVLESGTLQTDLELGVALAPGLPGGTRHYGSYSRAFWFPKDSPEAEQEAGWKFVKWLMEPEQQAEWFAGSGYLSVRNSAYDLPAAQEIMAKYPQFRVPVDAFLASPADETVIGPLLGPFLEVRETVIHALEEMILNNKDPKEALDDAAKEANQIIEKYNERVQ
jgi:sn-glycerol 3-phosphate transport system substrate-binding protein